MESNELARLMNDLTKILKVIKKKYPGQSVYIDKLYEEDEDFRSLCSDYYLSLQDLKRFHATLDNSQHSIKEYEEVIEALEKEINNFIFS